MLTKILQTTSIRNGCLVLSLVLAMIYSNGALAQAIRIQDDTGVDLVVFYPDGNISILYGIILSGSEADLTSDPGVGEFIIKNAMDEVVFRIPSDTGHVHLKGTVEQGITATLNPGTPAFKVEDSTGELVAYIDEDGNQKTKGIIYLQGIPTDGIPQSGGTFTRNDGNFNYPDFSSTDGLTLRGDAVSSGATIKLVPGPIYRAGAVWRNAKVPVGLGFEVTFDFSLATTNAGADGLAFVIQNSSATPPLSPGGNIGYGLTVPSLAVEFDVWRNTEFDPDELNANHISVQTRGPSLPNSADPQYSIGANHSLSVTLESGATHTARILYDPSNDSLEVYLNGTLELLSPPSIWKITSI